MGLRADLQDAKEELDDCCEDILDLKKERNDLADSLADERESNVSVHQNSQSLHTEVEKLRKLSEEQQVAHSAKVTHLVSVLFLSSHSVSSLDTSHAHWILYVQEQELTMHREVTRRTLGHLEDSRKKLATLEINESELCQTCCSLPRISRSNCGNTGCHVQCGNCLFIEQSAGNCTYCRKKLSGDE